MPSSAASAAMLRGFWAKLKVSSVMLIWKCLAMWRRPNTAPTTWPIAAAPRSGRRARCTRAAMRARSFSVPANSFAGPLFGEQRVLADHQAFARIVGAGDLRHIAVIKQRGLQRPACGRELLDRRSPQRGDPIEPGRAQRLLDARAGQQPAVAHHHHALQLEALLQLVDL